uniref:Myomesin 3 n=1 Tax=Astyanax mexicanus TaxID=7994 RepID=A0A3B1K1B2_ASTMX
NSLILSLIREVLKETMADDELRQRDKWTLFGNEAEKVEIGVIRNQHVVRKRVDRMALRRECSLQLKFLEDLSRKEPDFPVPLRPHTVWEGMAVKLSCTVQGSPLVETEALFDSTFPPSFVKEGETLVLSCGFTSPLLPFQQDMKIRTHLMTNLCRNHTFFCVYLCVCVSDGAAAVVGAAGSPLQVECSDVNRDYVFLSWKPPSADGAAPVQGYYIERSVQGQHFRWSRCNEVVQKVCYYPVMGLQENTMYQFRVCAVNQAGVGRPSKPTEPILTSDPMEPSRTMGNVIRVPFPPTGVSVCELSDSYAVISWTEPDPRGKEPLTYFVERSIAGKNSWHLASMDMTVQSTRFAAFDLQKGKSYCFRVRSINKYGISDPSEPSQPITLGEPLGVPAAPHCIQAVADTDSSAVLLWKEPKNTEGILGYYLYCSEVGTSNWRTINNKPVNGTRFTVHGLNTNKDYVFRVKSVGRAGNSHYSEESQPVRIKAAKVVPSPPSGVCLLHCSGSEMVIGWRAPANQGGEAVKGYFLDQREKPQTVWREVNPKPVKERVYKVSALLEGHYYQFRLFASNVIGLSKPSQPSEAFLCEPWTMPEPGCPYDLELREVRRESLVVMWAEPLYQGQSQITGYVVEISQGEESEDWTEVTQESVTDRHLKVSGPLLLKTYRLRVSAVNSAGVGRPSLPTEPITAQTKPGTKDMEIGVDNDGFIFLSFQASETAEDGQFKWNKNYRETIDAGRAHLETKHKTVHNLWEIEFDIAIVSRLTDLERLTELSWQIRNPSVIALRSEGWQVEVSDQGAVRLWLQTEPLSSSADLRMILNDREITSTPARKINFDKPNGLVEILFDQLSKEDEGSYTAQLKDGRAKNQFTLVLVDENKMLNVVIFSVFSEGPYFEEFLSWTVTEDCEMIMKCKVATDFLYVHLTHTLSASPLGIQCTAAGFKLYCSLKYYLSYMKTSWYFKEKKMDQGERNAPGSSMQKVWNEIFNPTENDKGKYTLEMFDGQETHKRHLDLSGQGTAFCQCFFLDRAKVTKGLPDVVAIMEGKSLCLTCFADGDPAPEMFWLKNDREITSTGQYHIAHENKCTTITISSVTMEDSGNYSIFVRNSYGSQTVHVTVSVYKHGEKPRAGAVEM